MREMKMASLKDMCGMVDDFTVNGTSTQIEGAYDFWKSLNKDSSTAQLYAECLIYKYVAISYGLGEKPLFETLSQIKNISATDGRLRVAESGRSPSPTSGPGGAIKQKRGSGSFEHRATDVKSTPKKKKLNKIRRKSEEGKMSKKELTVDGLDGRRKKSSKDTTENKENSTDTRNRSLDDLLLSLTYIAKMCDLTRWDFAKLREVFLMWNKTCGWDKTAADYEYTVMKRFSMPPTANIYDEEQVKRCLSEILASVTQVTEEPTASDGRNVGESIKYWEIRHKVLTRSEEAVAVINCLTLLAKKIFGDGDEAKILPLLHLVCETVIMSPHTPLELLQECYSALEQFYVWPSYVARPVKEVLDMIQLEMKCPGHFYRMIFFQDNEIPLSPHLAAKMPSSETHVFVDKDVGDSEALSEAFRKLSQTRASSSKLTAEVGMFRFVIRHIFESVFGCGCCDLNALDHALQDIPENDARDLCHEVLAIMEEASMKKTHGQAQDFLRAELEVFSDRLTNYLEESLDEENDDDAIETESVRPKQASFRRASVIYEIRRARDVAAGLQAESSISGGEIGTPSPRRNNSYLRRNTSGSLDNTMGAKKLASKANALSKETLAELIGPKVSTLVFNQDDLSDTVYDLVRSTSKEFAQEKKMSSCSIVTRKKDSNHLLCKQGAYRDSGVMDDEEATDVTTAPVQNFRIDEEAELRADSPPTASSSSNDDSENFSSAKREGESFWEEFKANGFDVEDKDLVGLLETVTFDQRKSFILETEMKRRQGASVDPPKSSETPILPESPNPDTTVPATAAKQDSTVIVRRQSSKSEHNKLHRLSRLVRNKKRSARKERSEGSLDNLPLIESAELVSSTISDELIDSTEDLRIRKTSSKKRGKWRYGTSPRASPSGSKTKRHGRKVDAASEGPPLNSSVRSLKGDIYRQASPLQDCNSGVKQSPAGEDIISLTSLRKSSLRLDGADDNEGRRRIDSGIGPETTQSLSNRRTTSYSIRKEEEDHGIGGVKFAMKEVQRAVRRHRISVSDDLDDRKVHKKVLKLVFVGNDKTVGHVARAYYNLRKRQMSYAPLFQHIDLRLFFIPVPSMNLLEKEGNSNGPGSCDIRVGELLGSYDSWYHTVITLSVGNLLRVSPKASADDEVKHDDSDSPPLDKQLPVHKPLAPEEVIASALLSYCRFAVSKAEISMFKVVMLSSSGTLFDEVFCCRLNIGHEAYTTAVKAGRFGKLGKLVDLSNDSGPLPAYTKIEYSKWSMEGQLKHAGQMPDTFYHSVCVMPMSLCKTQFKGTEVLQLLLVDNEKRQKLLRRTSSYKLSAMEEAEVAGNVLEIGTMSMEVVRPVQGAFSVVLDDSKIYTNIKSIEIAPCSTPEARMLHDLGRNAQRRLGEHHLIKLPLRTFWPATQ